MRSSSCWPSAQRRSGSNRRAPGLRAVVLGLLAAGAVLQARPGIAGAAPPWMRAQLSASLPAHDEETLAALLYAETILSVKADGRMRRLDRRVYRILRPDDGAYGSVRAYFDSQSRIIDMHAWCIPATGKDYEVRYKDAVESAVMGVNGGELVGDVRIKRLRIPATEPGSIVGYEIEQELRPYLLADSWEFQEVAPVRESHYTLQLPPGWGFKATWLHHDEVAPTAAGAAQWTWVLSDVAPIRIEEDMPPWRGIAGSVFITLLPPAGRAQGMQSWHDVGAWYLGLVRDRRDATPEIRQQVAAVTGSQPTPLARMQALAKLVQNDIRYVAIELGIGGYQPHPAAEVFTHRYGDCKDKVTLLSTMLKEIGVDSHYVIVNTARGSITGTTPPTLEFNHVVLAVQLPAGVDDPSLVAVVRHPQLGRILYFDPTDHLTPFGRLRGALQANYGLLVTPDGGDLVELPQAPSNSNAINRTARMALDAAGVLRGTVRETWVGDLAAGQRDAMASTTRESDRIKPLEAVAARSFAMFDIVKSSVKNAQASDQPFEWNYELKVASYAKSSGDLLLVRPRILGSKSSALLETRKPRQHPVEFSGPQRDTDVFEIELPAGYEVDELPPPVNAEHGFASYQSRTEIRDHVLRYTRSFEIRELSVPVAKADSLRDLYRTIASDERMVVVLKRTAH